MAHGSHGRRHHAHHGGGHLLMLLGAGFWPVRFALLALAVVFLWRAS